jgi:LysM repeat protein
MQIQRHSFALLIFLLLSISMQAQTTSFTHQVKRGETLYSISNLYHVTVANLEALNPGSGQGIREGQVIQIPQKKAPDEKPRYHTILPGETLYRLTKMYGISAQAICDTNPGLSADNFKAGQIIVIPATEPAAASQPASATQSQAVNTAQAAPAPSEPRCRDMHKVTRHETLYSIAKDYGISVEELTAANPELADPSYKLKKGHYLCIPFGKVAEKKEVTDDAHLFPAKQPVAGLDHLHIAVCLPMENGNNESLRMVEYYRGVLLAVDSLKRLGISTDVYAFESGTTEESLSKVLLNPTIENMDLIFGPLYSAQTKMLGDFCHKHGIRMVIPFTNHTTEVYGNPAIYQINAPQSYQLAEVYGYFGEYFHSANIVLLTDYSDPRSQEADFIIGLKKELVSKGMKYQTLSIDATDSQIADAMSRERENVIVPTASGIATLNRLMPILKDFHATHAGYQLHLFGYPSWQTYTSVHLDNFYLMDTYIYSAFYRNPVGNATARFDRTYRNAFHRDMLQTYPRFAMLGFDTAFYFMRGLSLYGKANFDSSMKDFRPTLYQNDIHMQRVSNWGGFINHQMKFIHYTRNGSIETNDVI